MSSTDKQRGYSKYSAQDVKFIGQNLYRPICKHVTNFLNTDANSTANAQSYFTFLFDNTDFYKVVRGDDIKIIEFANMPAVNTFTVDHVSDCCSHVTFSNQCIILMRFHTISSRLGLSLNVIHNHFISKFTPKRFKTYAF